MNRSLLSEGAFVRTSPHWHISQMGRLRPSVLLPCLAPGPPSSLAWWSLLPGISHLPVSRQGGPAPTSRDQRPVPCPLGQVRRGDWQVNHALLPFPASASWAPAPPPCTSLSLHAVCPARGQGHSGCSRVDQVWVAEDPPARVSDCRGGTPRPWLLHPRCVLTCSREPERARPWGLPSIRPQTPNRDGTRPPFPSESPRRSTCSCALRASGEQLGTLLAGPAGPPLGLGPGLCLHRSSGPSSSRNLPPEPPLCGARAPRLRRSGRPRPTPALLFSGPRPPCALPVAADFRSGFMEPGREPGEGTGGRAEGSWVRPPRGWGAPGVGPEPLREKTGRGGAWGSRPHPRGCRRAARWAAGGALILPRLRPQGSPLGGG